MQEINFLEKYQKSTQRDYVARVVNHDKSECAAKAKLWGHDYWDGERQYGYGGYHYDGRWHSIAVDIAKHYGLKAGDKVLDIGCGKGFLLYELTQVVPGIEVTGMDVSSYAVEHAKLEIKDRLHVGHCSKLPFPDQSFDFVYSINTFHNLSIDELESAVREMERVGKQHKWCNIESYRNEKEKANLLYWQLTCESFHRPEGWRWLFQQWGYQGDYGFIYFA
ncbi:MAG: SAM-dependent methyltransferase [Gammaproteobacteria bacterium RIFCSPHIGHO2_12_FULL_42_10]|nr:MAG: SAM-dependent methyltransferase [Gammaproteobacteria bacterium RIFCSPHIGHO2_12_FULL_42_10]